MKLDLHGYPIHRAWHLFDATATDAYFNKQQTFVVITGQGAIMNEIITWATLHHRVKSCSPTPNNPGRFVIRIKKG